MRNSVALGIDISDGLINMAMLKKSPDGIELLKVTSGPVPEGAINNGIIEDPVMLAKAIKDIKKQGRISTKQAAVSLSVKPLVMNIIDAPKGSPNNIGQYVRNELRSYVTLSGKEIAFDFCGLKQIQGSVEQLLTAATDAREVRELTDVYGYAGLNVDIIEPPLLAYIRVLYNDKIKDKYNSNVLLAFLKKSTLTLCLFRKEFLELVKIENIQIENTEQAELSQWIATQINTIIKFYNLEVSENIEPWEITIVKDDVQLSEDFDNELKTQIKNDTIEISCAENMCPFAHEKDKSQSKPSLVAIGLAMNLLNMNETNIKINLLPQESSEVKSLNKQFAVTAIITVIVSLTTILIGPGLSFTADEIYKNSTLRKQKEETQDTYTLLKEQEFLDKQIKLISQKPEKISSIIETHLDVDWSNILTDIRNRTPQMVRITKLSDTKDAGIRLEGMALSYEAIRLFVKLLNDSEYISSASLIETTKNDQSDGFIAYLINCSLNKV